MKIVCQQGPWLLLGVCLLQVSTRCPLVISEPLISHCYHNLHWMHTVCTGQSPQPPCLPLSLSLCTTHCALAVECQPVSLLVPHGPLTLGQGGRQAQHSPATQPQCIDHTSMRRSHIWAGLEAQPATFSTAWLPSDTCQGRAWTGMTPEGGKKLCLTSTRTRALGSTRGVQCNPHLVSPLGKSSLVSLHASLNQRSSCLMW